MSCQIVNYMCRPTAIGCFLPTQSPSSYMQLYICICILLYTVFLLASALSHYLNFYSRMKVRQKTNAFCQTPHVMNIFTLIVRFSIFHLPTLASRLYIKSVYVYNSRYFIYHLSSVLYRNVVQYRERRRARKIKNKNKKLYSLGISWSFHSFQTDVYE